MSFLLYTVVSQFGELRLFLYLKGCIGANSSFNVCYFHFVLFKCAHARGTSLPCLFFNMYIQYGSNRLIIVGSLTVARSKS